VDVVDCALTTRCLTAHEIAEWPSKAFVETRLGMQAILLVVPEQVWKSGVRALTRGQLREIYEGRLANWKEIGGEDRPIIFYNRPVTGGLWDALMVFLYQDARKAPETSAEILVDSAQVTVAVDFNPGAISAIQYGELQGNRIHALGIKLPDGTIIEPTVENIASGKYELARPLMMVTSRKPAGKVRRFIDFMLSAPGQDLVTKSGHLANAVLPARKPR
jgi:phosphate transport system substrate-binding protein